MQVPKAVGVNRPQSESDYRFVDTMVENKREQKKMAALKGHFIPNTRLRKPMMMATTLAVGFASCILNLWFSQI